jgi:hypothetical protein
VDIVEKEVVYDGLEVLWDSVGGFEVFKAFLDIARAFGFVVVSHIGFDMVGILFIVFTPTLWVIAFRHSGNQCFLIGFVVAFEGILLPLFAFLFG